MKWTRVLHVVFGFTLGLGLTNCANAPDVTREVDYMSEAGRAVIPDVIHSHLSEIRTCYEERLKTNEELVARITFKFKIQPTGRVSDVTALSADGCQISDPVVTCMGHAIATWQFNPSKEDTNVTYPFILRRSGQR